MIALYFLMKKSELFDLEAIHYLIIWLTLNVAIVWGMFTIKQVSVDVENKQIQVSGFRKTELIPFSEVEYVSGSRFTVPEQVWFRTRDKKTTVFMAKMRFVLIPFKRHPMVKELAKTCGINTY